MGISELGVLIPIIAVTLGLGCAIVSVVSSHRRRLHELEFRHRERMAAIDKGLELPPEPTDHGSASTYEQKYPRSGARVLLKGLVWFGVGLALVMPGNSMGYDHQLWTPGWIAVAVGAAYLIYYFVEARHRGPPGHGPGGAGSMGAPGSSKEGPRL